MGRNADDDNRNSFTDATDGVARRVELDSGTIGSIASYIPDTWDYSSVVRGSLTDTWTFKTGGSGGTTIGTVVITYSATNKKTITTIDRTLP